MQKAIGLLVLLCSLLLQSAISDQFLMTLKAQNSGDSDRGVSILASSNGEYILLGQFQGESTALVAQLNYQGVRNDHTSFNSVISTQTQVVETSSNNIIVASMLDGQVLINALNANLAQQWGLSIGVGTPTTVTSIVMKSDTEFMIVGSTTHSSGVGESDIMGVAISNGNVAEVFTIGSSSSSVNDYGKGVVLTSDGGYLFLGRIAGSLGNILAKVSSTYQWEWGKTLTGDSNQYGFEVIERRGSTGYFLVGYDTASTNSFIVVITDTTGSISWSRRFTGSYSFIFSSITTASDGGITFVGSYNTWPVLVKMSSVGIMHHVKSYRFLSNGNAHSIAKAISGNGVVMTGEYLNNSDRDIFVMEVDSDGQLDGSFAATSQSLSQTDIFSDFTTASLTSSNHVSVSNSNGPYTNHLDKPTIYQSFQFPTTRAGSNFTEVTTSSTTSTVESSAGLIAGVAICVSLIIVGVIVILCCCRHQRRKRLAKQQNTNAQKNSTTDRKEDQKPIKEDPETKPQYPITQPQYPPQPQYPAPQLQPQPALNQYGPAPIQANVQIGPNQQQPISSQYAPSVPLQPAMQQPLAMPGAQYPVAIPNPQYPPNQYPGPMAPPQVPLGQTVAAPVVQQGVQQQFAAAYPSPGLNQPGGVYVAPQNIPYFPPKPAEQGGY